MHCDRLQALLFCFVCLFLLLTPALFFCRCGLRVQGRDERMLTALLHSALRFWPRSSFCPPFSRARSRFHIPVSGACALTPPPGCLTGFRASRDRSAARPRPDRSVAFPSVVETRGPDMPLSPASLTLRTPPPIKSQLREGGQEVRME